MTTPTATQSTGSNNVESNSNTGNAQNTNTNTNSNANNGGDNTESILAPGANVPGDNADQVNRSPGQDSPANQAVKGELNSSGISLGLLLAVVGAGAIVCLLVRIEFGFVARISFATLVFGFAHNSFNARWFF